MLKSADEKKRAIARLRRIKGQAEGLERAIERDTSCAALLQQIVAMRGATNGLMTQVLESHLRDTFAMPSTPGETPDATDEIMALLRTYLK